MDEVFKLMQSHTDGEFFPILDAFNSALNSVAELLEKWNSFLTHQNDLVEELTARIDEFTDEYTNFNNG